MVLYVSRGVFILSKILVICVLVILFNSIVICDVCDVCEVGCINV